MGRWRFLPKTHRREVRSSLHNRGWNAERIRIAAESHRTTAAGHRSASPPMRKSVSFLAAHRRQPGVQFPIVAGLMPTSKRTTSAGAQEAAKFERKERRKCGQRPTWRSYCSEAAWEAANAASLPMADTDSPAIMTGRESSARRVWSPLPRNNNWCWPFGQNVLGMPKIDSFLK